MTEAERARLLAYLSGGEDTQVTLQGQRPLGIRIPTANTRSLFGRPRTMYLPPDPLPPSPIPRGTPIPPRAMQQRAQYPIGPGGIIDQPPAPLHYSSVSEAAQPSLADVFAPPEPPPAPEFGVLPRHAGNSPRDADTPPLQAAYGWFGTFDGLTEDQRWQRALSRVQAKRPKPVMSTTDRLFAGVFGRRDHSARR